MFNVLARSPRTKSAYAYVADTKNITTTKSPERAALWLNHYDAKNFVKSLKKQGWSAKYEVAPK